MPETPRVLFEAVREAAFGAIGVAYAAMGTAIAGPARIIAISNATDADIYISFDGTNDHLRLAANSFKLIDIATNRTNLDDFLLANGTIIYQRRVAGAPTAGTLWVEVVRRA